MEETAGKAEGEVAQDSGLEALKLENESLKGELKSVNERIFELEKTIAEKDAEIASIKQSMEDSTQAIAAMEESLLDAIEAYRELAVQANPGLVAEMVKGDTIEAIKESVESARTLVERVKQEIGAENSSIRVPAGTPGRTLPDLSTLSPREKIKYGMEA